MKELSQELQHLTKFIVTVSYLATIHKTQVDSKIQMKRFIK